jgi:light-regulated signal transduction histidine kinase (bacteriophytochrome)
MTKLATSILNDIRYSSPSIKANIVIHPLLPVDGDSSLLSQVFTNLISNAIKYSEGKDTPVIEIGSREEEDEAIYYVKDNGAGFDMKYYDKLFGVFQRLHREEEFEGTGVGLALVKRIITRHGGRVWGEAEVGMGATFYFSLIKKN